MGGTREVIIREALRLFGERGFAGTSVAEIERAAGLSAGSGALYHHFSSKDELLVEAVRARLADRGEWEQFLDPVFSPTEFLGQVMPDATTVDKLTALCEIGLARLEHDRDVTRILLRDNSVAPGVLDVFRREEFTVVTSTVARGLIELAPPERRGEDWDAVATVVVGAIAHFWLISDIFGGEHPAAVDAQRYLRATAQMIAARLDHQGNITRRD